MVLYYLFFFDVYKNNLLITLELLLLLWIQLRGVVMYLQFNCKAYYKIQKFYLNSIISIQTTDGPIIHLA